MALTARVDLDESSYADSYLLRSKKLGAVRTSVVEREVMEGSAAPAVNERGGEVYATPENARQRIQRVMGPNLRNQVRVDVRGIEDDMVRCQVVSMGGQDVTILLPEEIFPSDPKNRRPHLGASYSLALVEDGGVRKPRLEWLAGDANVHRAVKDRIAALAQAF